MAKFRGITITQPFGVIDPNYRLGFHAGTDLSRELGDKQPAYATGIARFQYAPPTKDPKARGGGYGNTGTITLPNGDVIFHSHLKDNGILVKNGSKVIEGQNVFITGDTGWINGIHEHVEYRIKGDINRPVDITKKLGEGMTLYKSQTEVANDYKAIRGSVPPTSTLKYHVGRSREAVLLSLGKEVAKTVQSLKATVDVLRKDIDKAQKSITELSSRPTNEQLTEAVAAIQKKLNDAQAALKIAREQNPVDEKAVVGGWLRRNWNKLIKFLFS